MKKIILFLIIAVFFFSIFIHTASAAVTGLSVQSCVAEDYAAKGSFWGACDGIYPSACGAGGDLLSCEDGNVETHGMTSSGYAGIKVSLYNSSVTDCTSVGDVFLCFDWFTVNAAGPTDCAISVDNQNGTNFTIINTTCPNQGGSLGITCQNVTSFKNWTCSNFFGATGNKTLVKSETIRSSGAAVKIISWDGFYYANLSYSATDTTAPTIALGNPVNNSWQNSTSVSFFYTPNDASDIANCTLILNGAKNQTNQSAVVKASQNNITITLNNGNYNWTVNCTDVVNNKGTNTSIKLVKIDANKPGINFTSPTTSGNITIKNIWANVTANDTNFANVTIYLYNSTGIVNSTFSTLSNYFVNFTNLVHGQYYLNSTAYDLAGNSNSTETRAIFINRTLLISNITANPNPISGGQPINISANGVFHSNNETLQFFCSNSTQNPTALNNLCSSSSSFPYSLFCSFVTPSTTSSYTVFCRVYDNDIYSATVNLTYNTSLIVPTTSVVSVAGDTSASYFDTLNDVRTDIIVSGDMNMTCRWDSSDLAYSSMTTPCTSLVGGLQANCSVNNVFSQDFITRYVSCSDLLGNGQSASQNLNVQFYLDYTAPTTSDNSVSSVQAPNYTITITEADIVDSDPITFYCTSSTPGCTFPTFPEYGNINDGGTITYTSANRGANYLRYYSIDGAGFSVIVNKTININQLPIFTSASDNAGTIKGGSQVNISSVSLDSDSGQNIILYVCSSSGATSSGCTSGNYCNATGSANLSCVFTSESDSAGHTWHAYVFDAAGEAASANSLTGSYTTDSTAPILTVISPTNTTYAQTSVAAQISSSEALSWAAYSLDNGNNISMTNVSASLWSSTLSGLTDENHNITFYANDSYGNLGSSSIVYFSINTTLNDTNAPIITITNPLNNSYSTINNVSVTVLSDEALSWAGYVLDGGTLTNLDNTTLVNWNTTLTSLTEGQHNLTIYGNDSSSNKNQGNKSMVFYVDLTNPQVSSFSCTNPVNDSGDVTCSYSVSDTFLNYLIIGYNATGSWINSSQISLSGTSSNGSYIISAGNTTPPGFTAQIYLYDLSGRSNLTTAYTINVSDDSYPQIYNITYWPNTTAELDPYVRVNVNATIVENYKIGSVVLMWQNLSDGNWISVTMTNNSAIANGSSATVVYNASFLPGNGTYAFKVNATDLAGNFNISTNITINVANESSFWNSTTIPTIKSFSDAQRSNNNTLGIIYLNNTGDYTLNLIVSIISSISNRFNMNYTNDDNASYSVSAGENISLTILINTTGLTGLNAYNLSVVSGVGTSIFEKYVYIQSTDAPYLVTSITKYSSSVTKGQTNVELIASISNYGTQDASGVVLTWTLPSVFTLTSGNLSRPLGNIPIGSSKTNTITVSVASSAADSVVNITANATATGPLSALDSKEVTIGSPVTVIQTITTGGGGGAGVGTGLEAVVYDVISEIVRGIEDEFEIKVTNNYKNSQMKDLSVKLEGFLPQYISITPEKISSIGYDEIKSFKIKVLAPTYLSYEEHDLKAIIKGKLIQGGSIKTYSETQNIKLIIQEITRQKAEDRLSDAEKAVKEMQKSNLSVGEVESLLKQARTWLNEKRRNKQSWDLSDEVVKIKETAFESDDLLRRLIESSKNPRKSNLIVGNVLRNIGSYDKKSSMTSLMNTKTIFASGSIEDVINLGIAAFERGDYYSALARAKEARNLLILERKGNFLLFIYLYWYYLLLATFLIFVVGTFGYKTYQKSSITRKIQDIDKEEENIGSLILSSQKNYFSGKISAGEYHRIMSQHQNKLAKIKQERLNLRNKRIKMLKQPQILQDLGIERLQVESEIKKLQEQFYRDRKISENEYNTEFKILNERLAEIEGEKITLEMLKQKRSASISIKDSKRELKKSIIKSEKVVKKQGRIRIFFLKLTRVLKHQKFLKNFCGLKISKEIFKSPFRHVSKIRENKRLKQEEKIKVIKLSEFIKEKRKPKKIEIKGIEKKKSKDIFSYLRNLLEKRRLKQEAKIKDKIRSMRIF